MTVQSLRSRSALGVPDPPPFEIRASSIAGRGAFGIVPIRKGTRVVEYVGERISHEEADRRYEHEGSTPQAHVLLFTVDRRTVIDAGVGGNDARFINHSCEPNCEPVIVQRRVFISAMRDIGAGEELTYDYNLERDGSENQQSETLFACHCGSPSCRGTQLEPRKDASRRRATRRRQHTARQPGKKRGR